MQLGGDSASSYHFSAVTMSDIHELQQQIKHLTELVQKLTTEFGAVKAKLEESRIDFDSICEILKDAIGVNSSQQT